MLCQRLLRRGGRTRSRPLCDARRHRDRNGVIRIPGQARPLSSPSSAKPTAISADGDASPRERPARFTFQARESVLFQSAGLFRIPAPWAPALNRTVREVTQICRWAGSRPRAAGRGPCRVLPHRGRRSRYLGGTVTLAGCTTRNRHRPAALPRTARHSRPPHSIRRNFGVSRPCTADSPTRTCTPWAACCGCVRPVRRRC